MLYLNKEEEKEIKILINSVKNIDLLYKKIYTLEIKNKKDSNEYKEMVEYLKLAKDIEDDIYRRNSFDIIKSIKWLKYLSKEKKLKSDIDYLAFQDYKNRIIKRIFDTIIFNMKYNNSLKFAKAVQAIEIDFYNSFLSILNDFIEKEEYSFLHQKLIELKYNVVFINKEYEQDFIDKNFDVSKDLYIISKIVSEINKIEYENIIDMKNVFGKKLFLKQMLELLEISDMDYNNTNKYFESIVRQILIKTAFLQMNDDELEKCNNNFHNYIESKEYIDKHPYDKISENIIINSFKKINKEKTRMKVISLKKS